MRARASLLGAALALAGCYHPYRPPRADEPHAVLKLRRVYETARGTHLHESAQIGDDSVFAHEISLQEMTDQRNDALLVHPRQAPFQVGGTFLHYETKLVSESYTVSVPYTTSESYSCGDYKSPRTCSRMVTSSRTESRTRMVNKSVAVTDGTCRGSVDLRPEVGHVYLLQYTYRDNGSCSLDCYEQTAGPDGQLGQAPCPVPPPLARR